MKQCWFSSFATVTFHLPSSLFFNVSWQYNCQGNVTMSNTREKGMSQMMLMEFRERSSQGGITSSSLLHASFHNELSMHRMFPTGNSLLWARISPLCTWARQYKTVPQPEQQMTTNSMKNRLRKIIVLYPPTTITLTTAPGVFQCLFGFCRTLPMDTAWTIAP